MRALYSRAGAIAPGLTIALVVAAAATFLSEHYDAPVMLYALLLGMALNFLTEADRGNPGIEFASKTVLRLGVALLGLRIGWDQVVALGWGPVVMVVAMVAITISLSIAAARLMEFNPLFGFLSGGATAICGASAALALSAALPGHEKKEQATLFTVIGVSALSTLTMVAYPVVAQMFGLDHHEAGIFIGATIHDVAQVVGADYAIFAGNRGHRDDRETGQSVAMLLPIILIAGQITRRRGTVGHQPPAASAVVRRRLHRLMRGQQPGCHAAIIVIEAGNTLSRWCLVTSISAIGMKTRLGEVMRVGLKPVLLMICQNAFPRGDGDESRSEGLGAQPDHFRICLHDSHRLHNRNPVMKCEN